ncbi:MAG: sigma 54-interacting transcriptional regulator [Deltaproteobacteria bacterium]|nr:sigma 54-interacting transcriptional regulator [Candidatus Anaeroferrophillus wilburensis]
MDASPNHSHATTLQLTENFYQSLLDNMKIGVIVCNAAGHIIYLNETYASFLGIDPAAQIGKHATEVVENSRLHIVAQTGQAEINYPHEFKDKSFVVHRVPIREGNEIIAVLGLVLFSGADIVKRLAVQLSHLQTKLQMYESELQTVHGTHYTFDSIVGSSDALGRIKEEALKATLNDFPVLITGESGTGKEIIAQAIHADSARRSYPFVRVNCAAIPKELFEAELFGYERGAFTGADRRGKAGKFEVANLGTIFLDEIGDLPLETQPKLLRVLEMKEFERIGGNRLIHSDFRVIAATNQKLMEKVADGSFRADLFYRLNVIALDIPALRNRQEDIIPLAHHFMRCSETCVMSDATTLDQAAENLLLGHHWPGNARELRNVIEQALVAAKSGPITVDDLPFYLQPSVKKKFGIRRTSTLKEYLRAAEIHAIQEALAAAGNNKSMAARQLGIHRTLLYNKMNKLGIKIKS